MQYSLAFLVLNGCANLVEKGTPNSSPNSSPNSQKIENRDDKANKILEVRISVKDSAHIPYKYSVMNYEGQMYELPEGISDTIKMQQGLQRIYLFLPPNYKDTIVPAMIEIEKEGVQEIVIPMLSQETIEALLELDTQRDPRIPTFRIEVEPGKILKSIKN